MTSNFIVMVFFLGSIFQCLAQDPDVGEPLLSFMDKNKLINFNPDDPMLERYHRNLRKSVRYEVEQGSLDAIEGYITEFEFSKTTYERLRAVMAEYHVMVYPVPGGGRGADRSRKPQNLKVLLPWLLRWDCDILFSVPEARKSAEEHVDPGHVAEMCGERIEYLADVVRRFYGDFQDNRLAEEALIRLALTPDLRAQTCFREFLLRFQSERELLPAQGKTLEAGIEDKRKFVEQLMELNKTLVKDGPEKTIKTFKWTRHFRIDHSEQDFVRLFFAEYLLCPQEGSQLAERICRELHEEAKGTAEKERGAIKERAKWIVQGCEKIAPVRKEFDWLRKDTYWFNE